MIDKINESNIIPEVEQINTPSAEIFSFKWFVQWGCLLATVFLFSSALNCLFRWLTYGYLWDLCGTFFSLIFAAIVYFTALNNRRVASFRNRLFISVFAIASWAIFLPLVMKMAGFK